MKKKSQKILVTGGAGFIGSHLVDALVAKKHRVFVIDNLSTGFKKNVNPKAKFYKADLTNHTLTEKIIKKEKPAVIFHLAAQIDVRKSVADPLFESKNNVLASVNLIETALRNKVRKFIFSSTGGALYGDTHVRPTPEAFEPWPVSPYGIGKLTIEKYLHYAWKIHGLNFTALRYPNVYGPRQNPFGEVNVIAIFLRRMLQGKQPIINGNGTQTRDYIYIDDITSANLKALEKFDKVGIYNASTAKEKSVNDIFREINKHFSGKFKEFHGPAKPGEQKTSCLSFKKTKKELGWSPKVDFRTGIRKTFEWFKKNHA
ncbi:MAG: NAD-dependent epimerase/dehydratase family protein [Patescibacteria group bacterium]|nr:NAD-dependent epimerase/dehydratase family protein [Patescibacteria group bacterium]